MFSIFSTSALSIGTLVNLRPTFGLLGFFLNFFFEAGHLTLGDFHWLSKRRISCSNPMRLAPRIWSSVSVSNFWSWAFSRVQTPLGAGRPRGVALYRARRGAGISTTGFQGREAALQIAVDRIVVEERDDFGLGISEQAIQPRPFRHASSPSKIPVFRPHALEFA